LDAILKNDLKGVRLHVDRGANPNVILSLTATSSSGSSTFSSSIHNNNMIDKVFLWKKLFGEEATLVHIAIVNIYHRSCYKRLRRELDTALSIFKLLLVHGADVSTKVPNLFVREFPHRTESTPMDLGLGLKRMALCSMQSGGKPEAAMDAAVILMQEHYQMSNNNGNKKSKKIPWNMVSVQGMDLMRELLFTEAITADDSTLISCIEEEEEEGDASTNNAIGE
jgi:hypothetical protein